MCLFDLAMYCCGQAQQNYALLLILAAIFGRNSGFPSERLIDGKIIIIIIFKIYCTLNLILIFVSGCLASYTRTPLCFSKLGVCRPPSTVGNTLTMDKYLMQTHFIESAIFLQCSQALAFPWLKDFYAALKVIFPVIKGDVIIIIL